MTRLRVWILAYVLLAVLAAAAVVGGVRVREERADRADETATAERYGDVIRAATEQAEAFVNIDYREVDEGIERVRDGSAGAFLEEWNVATENMPTVLQQNKSVMEGSVEWAGVVTIDADSATVIAATEGRVQSVQTDNQPTARQFRLRLELELIDGEWLTTGLDFVG